MTCLGSCAWAGGQASSAIRHQTNNIVEKTRRIFRVLPLPFQSNLCPRRPEVCQPAPVPHGIEIRGDGPKAIRVRRAWRCHCRINASCRVDRRQQDVSNPAADTKGHVLPREVCPGHPVRSADRLRSGISNAAMLGRSTAQGGTGRPGFSATMTASTPAR
jgi:hypothetical protein